MRVELTESGYLTVPAELAAEWFPTGSVIALRRGGELVVMPVHDRAAGGLLLKQRNLRGDRSVLIREVAGEGYIPGTRVARWDEAMHALRVPLEIPDGGH